MLRSNASVPLPRALYGTFGLLLVVLLVSTGLCVHTYSQLIGADRWNIHSYQVLLKVGEIRQAIYLCDSDVRGYASTGDVSFILSLRSHQQDFARDIVETSDLTADRPDQQARLKEVRGLFRNYQAKVAGPLVASVASAKSRDAASLVALHISATQRKAIEDMQQEITQFENVELAQLSQRGAAQEQLQDNALGAFWLVGIFAFFLVVTLMVAVARSAGRAQRAQLHLQDSLQTKAQGNALLAELNGELSSVNARLEESNSKLLGEVQERRDAENRVGQVVLDLKRSNEDLEQFAYVASHDLREPLRAVGGCVQVLQRRYAGKLDERADQLVQHAVEGAQRMQSLIDDLLAYSRVGTKPRDYGEVDLNSALARVLNNLKPVIEESGALIRAEVLPRVWGDAIQLEQVLQNLVGNALKFRGEGPPSVGIDCHLEEGQYLISVEDSGPGIEREYFDRIFMMFQRLHTRSEYPGTGIGLAVCKKIVERHGGRIWVESLVGVGATFYFTVPTVENGRRATGHEHLRQTTGLEFK